MIDTTYNLSKQKNLFLFLSGWLGLTLLSLLFSLIIVSFGPLFLSRESLDTFLQSSEFLSYLNLITYSTLFLVAITLTWHALPILLKPSMKLTQWVKGFGYGIGVLFVGITLGIVYDMLNITLDDNLNQATINSLVIDLPILSFLTFTLLGPIVEEFTYRLGLFTYISRRSRFLAYLVTLSLFGLIHFNYTNTNLLNEFLNLPFYLSAGLFFCYVYEKEGFFVVTLAHITNNLISILSILLVTNMGGSSL
jgi:membrane protease YdiL (CAAX protease family)